MQGDKMRKPRYNRSFSAVLALLIIASLIPLASCGGTKGASSGPEPGPSQANASAEEAQAQLAQDRQPAPPSPQEEAISALQDAGATASALAADPARAATDTEALKASVAVSTSELADIVSQTGDKLNELGLEGKQERFSQESAKVIAAVDSIKAASDGINPADPASYMLLSQAIDEAFASPEPAILSAELSHRAEPDTPVPPTYGASIAPAYLAGSPGLAPSSLPAEPGDGDLAETPDAPQSEEIVALASQLGNDPVAIYEWVRNNIDFESYYGSRKGAVGCLKEMAGNSTDTSSLLISLYRASGIPARYVTGVVELTADQACSWLATDTVSDAQSLLAAGGIPVTGLLEAGTLSKLQLTQTWTEAYVNYSNYRGAAAGEGPSDWIPLDASYKTYEVHQPQVDILSAMGASYDSLSAEYLSSVREETFLAFIEAKVKTWLSANMPQLTLSDVMRTKAIKQESLGLLPSDLLYKVVAAEPEERELPASSRWTATLDLAGTTLTCDFVSLASGALEVSFAPATSEDEAILSAYESIQDIPAYLLDMTGEMTAGEQSVQTQYRPFGSSSTWSMTISSPGRSYRIANTLTWGAPFSVVLTPAPGPVNGEITLEMGPNFPACLFDQAASSYISSITGDDSDLARLFGLSLTKGAQEASVGISLAPHTVSGVVVSASPDGIYIDADLSTATPAGKTKADRLDFTLASGLSSSVHEHKCLQDQFSAEAVSTAKLLALANQNVIPVVDITRSNASAIETLSLPAYVKQQMRDQANAGYTVTTPTRQITYKEFTGEGWMVTDPATGGGAYLISGGLAGGKTIDDREDWGFFWRTMIQRKHLDDLEILAPQEGTGFIKGESVEMIVKYTWTDNDTYISAWSINTARKEYVPGGYLMEVETKKTDPEIKKNVSWDLFGVFSQKEENDSLFVQALDLQGRPISGKYWDKGTRKELDVKTNWAWEEDQTRSHGRGARFLDQGVVIEHPELDPYLSEAGNDSVSFQLGADGGLYQALFWPGCPCFISGQDKEQALNERIFDEVSRSHPLVFELNQEIRLEFVKDSSGNDLGADQTRGSGQFIDPFVVRVTNGDGVPVEGAYVTFNVVESQEHIISWYAFNGNKNNPTGEDYGGMTYPPPPTIDGVPVDPRTVWKDLPMTSSDGKARACLKVSDIPTVTSRLDFNIVITAMTLTAEAENLTTQFHCEPFTVDTDGVNGNDMRPEDITYAGRRLCGIPVPPGDYPSVWNSRECKILDAMLRYDNENERLHALWPDYPAGEPELSVVCIEVPRAAYQFAHSNIYNLMYREHDNWTYAPNPGFIEDNQGVCDDMVSSRTWNWEELFYFHDATNYKGEHSLLMGQIYDSSGMDLIRYDLSYQIGDVAFMDLMDDGVASAGHSGLVIDILGDGDTAKYWNVCVIAADFPSHVVRMFEPNLIDSSWLSKYEGGEMEIPLEELPVQKVFAYHYEGEELRIIDSSIRVNPHPTGALYHGGFREPISSQ